MYRIFFDFNFNISIMSEVKDIRLILQSCIYVLWTYFAHTVCIYFTHYFVRLLSFSIDLEEILNISDRHYKYVFFPFCCLSFDLICDTFLNALTYDCMWFKLWFFYGKVNFSWDSLNKIAVICPLKIWKLSAMKLTVFGCSVEYNSWQLTVL